MEKICKNQLKRVVFKYMEFRVGDKRVKGVQSVKASEFYGRNALQKGYRSLYINITL